MEESHIDLAQALNKQEADADMKEEYKKVESKSKLQMLKEE